MLNIARQIYASLPQQYGKYDLPEAELTPLGETVSEKSKASKLANKANTFFKEFDNKPLPGFTLVKADRKNWGSLERTWVVTDPRGFMSRITSDNLEKILHVTGITEGLIQEKCVWAREDSQTKMILVPVSSPDYIDAVNNTELIENKISIKEVQIGDTVLMQNKLKGVYMGTLSLYGPMIDNRGNRYEVRSALRRQVVDVGHSQYFYSTNAKILKVVTPASTPLTKDEAAAMINSKIVDKTARFSSTTHFSASNLVYYAVNHASVHAVNDVKVSFEEITNLEATALFYDMQDIGDVSVLILEDAKGDRFIVDYPNTYGSSPVSTNSFNVCKISSSMDDNFIQLAERRRSYMHNNSNAGYSLDSFSKFYKTVKHVKNETYI